MTPERTSKDISTMHVLLIEDDLDDRQLVIDYLAADGPTLFSVESVDRLSAGLDRLSEGGLDAVLLDLTLPDSQGLQTFLDAHSHSSRVPIVILTGLNDAELAMRAVRLGAQDYLRKENLSAEVLIRALRYATERKQAEEQLRQAQKMEAIGQLAGGVAHDFNNLLAVILGNTEILQDCALHGDLAPRAVQRINQAAKSAASLTAQLLAFSRRQALRPVVLNPKEVILQVRELLRHLLRESIELAVRTDPDVGYICADPGQIEQVILNLAINARDAMPPGGTLTIEIRNVDFSDSYPSKPASIEPGRYVMLSVSDTGMGMDAETQEHIFEPFYTTKVNGTGLGLATVHGVVRQSGGHISVHSAPGCGSTIEVFLPRIEKLTRDRPDPPLEKTSCGTETILLVEDNVHLRELGREFLTAVGYKVLEAGSGEEALAVARNHHGSIHLLLSDVVLPSGSGPEVAQQMRALFPGIAVLYMSGYTSDVMSHHGVLDSGVVLLQKPFTRTQLLGCVRQALDTPKASVARTTG
jgi:two-component system cell cycle sensor histidine kinase/response regulator CckA